MRKHQRSEEGFGLILNCSPFESYDDIIYDTVDSSIVLLCFLFLQEEISAATDLAEARLKLMKERQTLAAVTTHFVNSLQLITN